MEIDETKKLMGIVLVQALKRLVFLLFYKRNVQ